MMHYYRHIAPIFLDFHLAQHGCHTCSKSLHYTTHKTNKQTQQSNKQCTYTFQKTWQHIKAKKHFPNVYRLRSQYHNGATRFIEHYNSHCTTWQRAPTSAGRQSSFLPDNIHHQYHLLKVDLRSDTVTKPSPAMRQAMANAEVIINDDANSFKKWCVFDMLWSYLILVSTNIQMKKSEWSRKGLQLWIYSK